MQSTQVDRRGLAAHGPSFRRCLWHPGAADYIITAIICTRKEDVVPVPPQRRLRSDRRQRDPASRRRIPPAWRAALLAGAAAGAAAVMAGFAGASADAGVLSAQYQGYSAPGGQDPYAGDNPQDVHVDGFGGQPVVTGYVRLDLDSLPAGSIVDGLTLAMVPNGSQSDNVNQAQLSSTAQPGIEACILDQPLQSNGFQASPPAYDCNQLHAVGTEQADGDWTFELAPLARRWMLVGNTGLALVAYPPPNDAGLAASPSAWSVAFDHTRTAATVDYTPGQVSPVTLGVQPLPPVAPLPAGTLAPLPAVNPPVVHAAPLPTAAAPAPTAAPIPRAPAITPTVVLQPRAAVQWVWVAVAMGGAALLMLAVGAGQQLLQGGATGWGTGLGAALAASRSQLATPVAVLALAAVCALGFSGGLTGLAGPGGAGSSALGGSGGGTAGGPGAGPGSAGPGGGPGGGTGAPGSVPGSAGATGAAAVAGGAGGPGASGGGANSPLNGPGVSSTAVRIGFVYVTEQNAANQLFGASVPSPGNTQSEAAAMVDYVNRHGGIAGRQIQPVYLPFSNAQADRDPNIAEEMCKSFTEDYHVFAVIGGGGPPDSDAANACYAQAGTLNFDNGQATPDLTFLRQTSPYIWMPEAAALDRNMRWLVAGLQSRGFFTQTPTYKLGVVIAQDAVNERVWQQVTLPALQAAGISNPSTFEVPHDSLDDTANTMKQAVIHFQTTGVTNVIFQGGGADGSGSYALLFMLSAESQHYNPRYGLSSDDGPVSLTGNVPQDQFKGPGGPALSIGDDPTLDTDDAHYRPWPSTADEKTCAAIQSAAGNSFSSREAAIAATSYCDAVFDLQESARPLTGGPLNAQLWANQEMQAGSHLYNATLYQRYVGPGHWDGAGGYRLLHAVQNCEGSNACFVYDNSTLYS
jgi:ABC-type branched-subunit amino acid transport system substrate-binding protein